MAEIDRRTLVRGTLCCAAFATVSGVALTTPELAKAVPFAAKIGPLERDDVVEPDGALETDGLLDVNDLLPEHAQQVQYWYRRRRRRRWWRRRRWVCWWRRGRLVCVRRW
jgi:hypothetical protein